MHSISMLLSSQDCVDMILIEVNSLLNNHLKDMTTKQMIELAEQQITWFVHRDQWGTIVDLAQSMWLSKEEWDIISRKNTWIPKWLKNELDEFLYT